MERYWCLRWLAQENARQVDAVVLKDEVLRLVDIPLVIRLPGMPQIARGLQVRLDLLRWDEVDLSVEVRLLDVPAAQSSTELPPEDEDENALLPGDTISDAAEVEADEGAGADQQAQAALAAVADTADAPGAAGASTDQPPAAE